jgi:hypothetical protein
VIEVGARWLTCAQPSSFGAAQHCSDFDQIKWESYCVSIGLPVAEGLAEKHWTGTDSSFAILGTGTRASQRRYPSLIALNVIFIALRYMCGRLLDELLPLPCAALLCMCHCQAAEPSKEQTIFLVDCQPSMLVTIQVGTVAPSIALSGVHPLVLESLCFI